MLPANITLSSLYFAETSSFNSECYSCSFVPLFIIRCFTWNMHETQMDSPVHKHFHKWICLVQIFMWTHKLSLFRSWFWFCCLLIQGCFQEQNGETSRLKQFRNWIASAYHGPKSHVSQTRLIAVFHSSHHFWTCLSDAVFIFLQPNLFLSLLSVYFILLFHFILFLTVKVFSDSQDTFHNNHIGLVIYFFS